ncbi:hypothetical protein WICPIJ_006310 [Wickerhamomyces pijperi]|uniref:ATP-dependent RNA helicase n=1 Tax=Wickerhamomyces pijperi TaxID=599730 RepID=A0A9P8Q482_WICPI|nr:hypothetical protein WICPIJ_006310 [Wickerhamomyces pijperi]
MKLSQFQRLSYLRINAAFGLHGSRRAFHLVFPLNQEHSQQRSTDLKPTTGNHKPTESKLFSNGKPCSITQGCDRGVLHELVKDSLLNLGFTKFSPVQAKSIEPIIEANSDLIIRAKTGTGKTLAFGIPLIQNAIRKPNRHRSVNALVIAPTRDLAFQIRDEFSKVLYQRHLSEHHKGSVIIQTLVGGEPRWQQMKSFEDRYIPSIVVATPGRLLDILQEPTVRPYFQQLKTLVLDEADRLLGDGFKDDLVEVNNILSDLNTSKKGMRTLLFSATLDKSVVQFSKQILKSGAVNIDTVDPNEPETHEKINQSLVLTKNLFESVVSAIVLIETEARRNRHFKAIVFLPTIKAVQFFYEILNQHLKEKKIQLNSNQLHGQLSQPVRDRSVRNFRTCFSGVLVASDVGARGMDFPNVTNVIQIGLPMDSTNYVHRVGRTARGGNSGRAVMILTSAESRFIRTLKERNVTITDQFEYDPVVHLEKRISDVSLRVKHKYSLDLVIESLAGFTKGVLGSYRLNMFQILEELKLAYRRFNDDMTKKPRVSLGFANQVLGLKKKDAEEIFELSDAVDERQARSRSPTNEIKFKGDIPRRRAEDGTKVRTSLRNRQH